MKKVLSVVVALLVFGTLIYADDISDIAKSNIGKIVNVFLKNYSFISAASGSYSVSLRGKLVETNETILVIYVENRNSSSIVTENFPAKVYIRTTEIAAIQISDK